MDLQLYPNPKWNDIIHPQVLCRTSLANGMLSVLFEIKEPESCFRAHCIHNGEPCWQDSCAEVFVMSHIHAGYYNFECNSNGVALAEFGTQRDGRVQMDEQFYRAFKRRIIHPACREVLCNSGDVIVFWSILIEIPTDLIGLDNNSTIFGNLYKCASCASTPHYLMAFPIDTPKPDFHRPEYFKPLV